METLENVVNSDFEQVTYTEAVEILTKSGQQWEFPVAWGSDLQSEHERYLTEQTFKKPVIVTDFPKEIKAFYMRSNDDGKTVRAMDVLAPRIGEIAGGSQREGAIRHSAGQNYRKQELKRGTHILVVPMSFASMAARRTRAFGLGFDRLMLYLTGMKNIRDVIPFPRTP